MAIVGGGIVGGGPGGGGLPGGIDYSVQFNVGGVFTGVEDFLYNTPLDLLFLKGRGITLQSRNLTDYSRLIIRDSLSVQKLLFGYSEDTNLTQLDTSVPLAATIGGDLNLGVAGNSVFSTLTNLLLESSHDDTTGLLILSLTGANGGAIGIIPGTRNPEGFVTASGGYLYVRSADTSSGLYIKKLNAGNTGWVRALDTDFTPASTVDNSVVLFNGTTGESIDYDPGLLTSRTGDDFAARLKNSTAVSKISVEYRNSLDSLVAQLSLDSNASKFSLGSFSSHEIEIASAAAINIIASGTSQIETTNTKGTTTITNTGQIQQVSNLPDTSPGFSFQQTGANGGAISYTSGTRNPNGLVPGNGGDLYSRRAVSGATLYVMTTDGGTTDWYDTTSSQYIDLFWKASISRHTVDSPYSQGITSVFSKYEAFLRNDPDIIGDLLPNATADIIEIEDISNTSVGDLFRVEFTGSIAATTNTYISMRIVATDGTTIVGGESNAVQTNSIYCAGSNYYANFSMNGTLRGPASFAAGIPGIYIIIKSDTTSAATVYSRSIRLEVQRIL